MADEVAATLRDAYRDGLAGPFEENGDWHALRAADSEWDDALVFLARDDASGALLGACHGWTSGFLKDVGVAASERGRGIGAALVLTLASAYRARGLSTLDLKIVPVNEPARRFYAGLGFRER